MPRTFYHSHLTTAATRPKESGMLELILVLCMLAGVFVLCAYSMRRLCIVLDIPPFSKPGENYQAYMNCQYAAIDAAREKAAELLLAATAEKVEKLFNSARQEDVVRICNEKAEVGQQNSTTSRQSNKLAVDLCSAEPALSSPTTILKLAFNVGSDVENNTQNSVIVEQLVVPSTSSACTQTNFPPDQLVAHNVAQVHQCNKFNECAACNYYAYPQQSPQRYYHYPGCYPPPQPIGNGVTRSSTITVAGGVGGLIDPSLKRDSTASVFDSITRSEKDIYASSVLQQQQSFGMQHWRYYEPVEFQHSRHRPSTGSESYCSYPSEAQGQNYSPPTYDSSAPQSPYKPRAQTVTTRTPQRPTRFISPLSSSSSPAHGQSALSVRRTPGGVAPPPSLLSTSSTTAQAVLLRAKRIMLQASRTLSLGNRLASPVPEEPHAEFYSLQENSASSTANDTTPMLRLVRKSSSADKVQVLTRRDSQLSSSALSGAASSHTSSNTVITQTRSKCTHVAEDEDESFASNEIAGAELSEMLSTAGEFFQRSDNVTKNDGALLTAESILSSTGVENETANNVKFSSRQQAQTSVHSSGLSRLPGGPLFPALMKMRMQRQMTIE